MAPSSPPPLGEQKNSRREFLQGLVRKTGDLAVGEAQRRIEAAAPRYVRPPGALAEAEFLVACTRCGECLPACPESTVFLLGPHTGVAAGTPALDLVNQACVLCADWPCIAACEPGALLPVAPETLRFATLRIDSATCLPFQGPECGVCVSVCPVPGALRLAGTRPVIDHGLCTGCAVCRRACIVFPSAITVHPRAEG